ncbi:hypothetical protein FA13DRAFT_991977 [Coprinellus micaceus]|uniref:Uncharacterized protein n=1 Tax=Coprinellus micaceus TaxID=71717 RepID=A0A4Y7SY66_COPMI|nr:hypothetical protein FA13DRAFT_991977 [Coprinellus micaceus]
MAPLASAASRSSTDGQRPAARAGNPLSNSRPPNEPTCPSLATPRESSPTRRRSSLASRSFDPSSLGPSSSLPIPPRTAANMAPVEGSTITRCTVHTNVRTGCHTTSLCIIPIRRPKPTLTDSRYPRPLIATLTRSTPRSAAAVMRASAPDAPTTTTPSSRRNLHSRRAPTQAIAAPASIAPSSRCRMQEAHPLIRRCQYHSPTAGNPRRPSTSGFVSWHRTMDSTTTTLPLVRHQPRLLRCGPRTQTSEHRTTTSYPLWSLTSTVLFMGKVMGEEGVRRWTTLAVVRCRRRRSPATKTR